MTEPTAVATVLEPAQAPDPHPRQLPGNEGIWVFVLIDLAFFALLFVAFGTERAKDVELFDRTRDGLNAGLGLVNLVVLLTSSWLAALAVHALRDGSVRLAARLLGAASACGVVFVVIKLVEYRVEVLEGANLADNPFFTLYFVMTGLHFLHVLVGVLVLALCARSVSSRKRPRSALPMVESAAVYWHMVDLLWVMIFPTLYLAR